MRYSLNLSLIQKKRCLYKSLTITGRACIGDICAFRKFGIDFLDRTDCCLERASVVITVEGIKKLPSSPTSAVFVVVDPASIPR